MDKKKIIIIGLIIIILASCVILINTPNTFDSDNYNSSKNNTTENNNVSNDAINDSSLNSNQITKSGRNTVSGINEANQIGSDEKSNNSIQQTNFKKKQDNGFSPSNNKNNSSTDNNESKMLEITAQDIKNHMKEKNVHWNGHGYDEVDVGEPFKYYSSAWGMYVWLVPAFDKNTGEYLGAIVVRAPSHKNSDGTFGVGYSNGPSWYSNYLAILAGEPTQPEIYDIPTHFDVDTSSQDSGLMSSFSNSSGSLNTYQTTESTAKRNYTVNLQFNEKNDSEFSPTNAGDESNLIKVTPEDIKKRVEEGVNWGEYGQDVRIDEPYLIGSPSENFHRWLVPAFNKTSDEFVGSVWVDSYAHKDGDGKFGGWFMHGVDSYSDYLAIISGQSVPAQSRIVFGNSTVPDIHNGCSYLNSSSDEFNVTWTKIKSDEGIVNSDLTDSNIDLNNSSKSYSE